MIIATAPASGLSWDVSNDLALSCALPHGVCYKWSFSPVSVHPIDSIARRSADVPVPFVDALTASVVLVTGGPDGRRDGAAAVLSRLMERHPTSVVVETTPRTWPFDDPVPMDATAWPNDRVVIVAPDLHEAFENAQTNSTQLVTTQPGYTMQAWLDALARRPDVVLLATADATALDRVAPDAVHGRGPWRSVQRLDVPMDPAASASMATPAVDGLPAAFRDPDPARRLAMALDALSTRRTPAHLLAAASACMEVNDLSNAEALLSEAVAAAPDWAAAWFEQGKLWLRSDDMARAADAFGRASDLMPAFASAAANWGATLGELDRPDAALVAFERALAVDPDSAQALNNVGVVRRELGKLEDSEQAFRRVVQLSPNLAFGHYNLGHTLFLQGRFHAAVTAYATGQGLDPGRNPVQASRLALARLGAGDAEGALRDLRACTTGLPQDLRRQLLQDVHAVAFALLTTTPDLRGWQVVGDWLTAELGRG